MPEILNEGTHSKEVDIFSFVKVVIEVHYKLDCMQNFGLLIQVFSGAIPFSHDLPFMVVLAITPDRPPPPPVRVLPLPNKSR